MVVFPISDILSSSDPKKMILDDCEYDLSNNTTSVLLDLILKAIPQFERFKNEKYLENWVLEIQQTEDEGFEFLIIHKHMDLLAFLLDDTELHKLDDIIETTSIDSFVTSHYEEFLKDPSLKETLLEELALWEIDSEYHPYAIAHLKFILDKGYDLAVFGGDKSLRVELNWDNEELFVGGVDEPSISANPDYSLAHEHFTLDNPEEAIELGIQAWSEFAEEDDDWEGDLDDVDVEDEFDEDDWDAEADDWDPGFDDEQV